MLFRRDAGGRDVELSGSTVALEVELQRRVEAGLEAMLGIRFLASEYPTGPWHRGRIDTLGLDENGSLVVIEYKDPLYAAPPLLQRMVEAGRLGRKTGSGFYTY